MSKMPELLVVIGIILSLLGAEYLIKKHGTDGGIKPSSFPIFYRNDFVFLYLSPEPEALPAIIYEYRDNLDRGNCVGCNMYEVI